MLGQQPHLSVRLKGNFPQFPNLVSDILVIHIHGSVHALFVLVQDELLQYIQLVCQV